MAKKWNTEMYVEYVEKNHPKFEVRGNYVNNNTKILMYHKNCKREFYIKPANFKTRGTCSLCNGKFKKTTKQFKEEVFQQVKDEYTVLGEYENSKKKIQIKHNYCNHEYLVTPDDFLNKKTRCPNCFGNFCKTTNQFKKEVSEKFGEEYLVLGEYKNNKTNILMKHNVSGCQHIFLVTPDAFLRGSLCNKCGTLKRSGKFHYKYNPNLTESERQARDMQNGKIRKWRDKVYARDNYTCQICHKKGGKLNAHHIFSWNKYEDKRFDLKNGITLCENCHKKFHHIYGYGNNNEIEFNYYLTNYNKNKQLALF